MRTLAGPLIVLALALPLGCKKAPEKAGEPGPAEEKPAAVALPGARHDLGAPRRLTEIEPNDTWQLATLVPDRAEAAGEFVPKKKSKVDDDWFKVAPGPGVRLALQIDVLPRGAATEVLATLEVLDRDKNRLARRRGSAGEPLSLRWLLCLEQCFIKLSGASGQYTLRVLGEPPSPAWELEPNDRAVDATELAAGAPMQGYYGPAGDADWFRLALPAPTPTQFLRVELSGVPEVRGSLEVRALDGALVAEYRASADGQPLVVRNLAVALPPPPPKPAAPVSPAVPPATAVSTADAGSVESDGGASDAGADATGAAAPPDAGIPAATSPPPTTPPPPVAQGFFLVVKPASAGRKARPAFNLKDAYTLTATLENGPEDLEREPNDDLQHATDLGPGLTRSGYLAPAGDVDWYRLHTDAPAILHLEVTPLERADLELSVYGAPARPGEKPPLLAKANEGGLKEGEVLPAVGIPAGDTFIKIESAARNLDGKWTRDTFDEKTLYKLTAQLSPDDGSSEKEPNDDPAHAQVVTLPASVRGFIWPRKDVDTFQFHIAEGHPPISVKVSAVRGVDLQLVLRELGPDGKGPGEIIGTADAVKGEGEEAILGVPVKPGDYQVEVSSPRHKDASATLPYTLTVQ